LPEFKKINQFLNIGDNMNISKKSINAKLKIISAKNIHNKNKRLWLRQREIKNKYLSEILTCKNLGVSSRFIVSNLAKHYNTNNKIIRKILTFSVV
tara:strand:+ start:58 stop:345 length:288 start_codon:yes stop_codon:yes gene_type:complete